MDKTEKLSFFKTDELPLPEGVKILTSVEVLPNNDIRFNFNNGTNTVVPRQSVTYVGPSIDSITYGIHQIAFLLSTGAVINVTLNEETPLQNPQFPMIRGFSEFKRLVAKGQLRFLNGQFTYGSKKLNPLKSARMRTTGNNTNITLLADTWTQAIINLSFYDTPGINISGNLITLPAGVWYVSGHTEGLPESESDPQS